MGSFGSKPDTHANDATPVAGAKAKSAVSVRQWLRPGLRLQAKRRHHDKKDGSGGSSLHNQRNRSVACRPPTLTPMISFIIQYYHHPQQLGPICERVCDRHVEIIVHADS